MSNARKLANLLGTSTTVPSSKLSLTAADMPTGSIIQTVTNATTGTASAKTNTSQEDVPNFSVTITPTSTSSKIYVSASMYVFNAIVASTNVNVNLQFARGTTILATATCGCHTGSGGLRIRDSAGFVELDAPATTSAITYKVTAATSHSASDYYINSGEIIAMEVAG